jgi:subtilisin family serine protease
MRITNKTLFGLLLSALFVSVGFQIHAEKPDKETKNSGVSKSDGPPAFRADRILVKPKKGVAAEQVLSLHGRLGAAARHTFKEIGGLQIVDLPRGVSVAQAKKHYEDSGLVEYAEPDYVVQMDATPNDPKYSDGSLWSLNNLGQDGGLADADIDAPEGWDTLHSAANVIVAVIDTGVRYTHEDLAANMWVNLGEIPGNGIDDDGDGYVDDVYGINAITGGGNPMDDNGHGSHVSGTIGGVGDNMIGVVGVAWRVQIMACKFLDANGSGSTSAAIECIDYAWRHGARVMNNSWGGGGFSQALMDAITAARDAGVIFVASAGNSSANTDINPQYPAGYDVENVVSVAATDRADLMAYFSNYGQNSVELGAPGVNIYSTYGTGDSAYNTLSGTSMAAPHVSGVMALTRARFPGLSYVDVIRRVIAATDPISSMADSTISGGRLNLQKALDPDPLAYFTATSLRGPSPLTVTFTDGSVGAIDSRHWDLGDGSQDSSSLALTHTYSTSGTYNVTLSIDSGNQTFSRTRSILAYTPVVYQISLTNFNWIDPTAMPTLALTDDSVSTAQPLPFVFTFYAKSYGSIYVGSNGLLGFDPAAMTRYSNSDLPDPSAPNAIVCPYWDDLNPGVAGLIHVGTVGTAPNRIAVVSWVGVPRYDDGPTPTTFYSFQVLLYEGSNQLVFQY